MAGDGPGSVLVWGGHTPGPCVGQGGGALCENGLLSCPPAGLGLVSLPAAQVGLGYSPCHPSAPGVGAEGGASPVQTSLVGLRPSCLPLHRVLVSGWSTGSTIQISLLGSPKQAASMPICAPAGTRVCRGTCVQGRHTNLGPKALRGTGGARNWNAGMSVPLGHKEEPVPHSSAQLPRRLGWLPGPRAQGPPVLHLPVSLLSPPAACPPAPPVPSRPPNPSGPRSHLPLNLPSCTEAAPHHTSPLHSPPAHLPGALGLVHWAPSCGQWTQPPQTVGSCPGVRAGWLSMGVRKWHGGCSQPPWAHLLLPKDTFLPGWQPPGCLPPA